MLLVNPFCTARRKRQRCCTYNRTDRCGSVAASSPLLQFPLSRAADPAEANLSMTKQIKHFFIYFVNNRSGIIVWRVRRRQQDDLVQSVTQCPSGRHMQRVCLQLDTLIDL